MRRKECPRALDKPRPPAGRSCRSPGPGPVPGLLPVVGPVGRKGGLLRSSQQIVAPFDAQAVDFGPSEPSLHAGARHQPVGASTAGGARAGGSGGAASTAPALAGSSAAATASSTRSSHTNASCSRTSSGMSSKSLRLRAGSMTRLMPARWAATTFSLMPPTGSTSPRREISPVIAVSERMVRSVISDTSAMNMATPALGPSFGVAPAGTWTWMSVFSNRAASIP